jgi:3-oxoacyl-[acyl-carrier protein] reductase
MTDKNPTAIVTGSSSGIGAATALGLAKRGWSVVINSAASPDKAEAVAEACRLANGQAVACIGDVSNDADCRRLVQSALDSWGRLDALVNSAGTTKPVAHADLNGLSFDDFQTIFAVNVIGPFQMARAAAPALRRSVRGAIVNISSNAGLTGAGSSIAYAASKAALNTMTLSLARALAPEIRVNAVLPGFTATPWHARWTDTESVDRTAAHYRSTSPLKRDTRPEDIADAVLWFIEGAAAVTGQLLLVDGGNHLHVNPAGQSRSSVAR